MGSPASTAAVSQAGSRLASAAGAGSGGRASGWLRGQCEPQIKTTLQSRVILALDFILARPLCHSATRSTGPLATGAPSEKYADSEAPVAMADRVLQVVALAVVSLGKTAGVRQGRQGHGAARARARPTTAANARACAGHAALRLHTRGVGGLVVHHCLVLDHRGQAVAGLQPRGGSGDESPHGGASTGGGALSGRRRQRAGGAAGVSRRGAGQLAGAAAVVRAGMGRSLAMGLAPSVVEGCLGRPQPLQASPVSLGSWVEQQNSLLALKECIDWGFGVESLPSGLKCSSGTRRLLPGQRPAAWVVEPIAGSWRQAGRRNVGNMRSAAAADMHKGGACDSTPPPAATSLVSLVCSQALAHSGRKLGPRGSGGHGESEA